MLKWINSITFKLSGNSERPAYPGFMVINIAHVLSNNKFDPSKNIFTKPDCMPRWIVNICCATTDKTSKSIRLNSSKHAQAPHDNKP